MEYDWQDAAWNQLVNAIEKINGIQHQKGSRFYIYGIGVANVEEGEGAYLSFVDADDSISMTDILIDIQCDLSEEISGQMGKAYGKFNEQTAAGIEEQDPEEE
jgi:hypothetical protein